MAYEYYTEEKVYDKKLAFLRISVLIIILLISYTGYKIYAEKQIEPESFFKESANQVIILQTNFDKTQSNFISAKKSILVEGYSEINIEKTETYIDLKKFKITNNNNMYLELATSDSGKSRVEISKLQGNIGNQRYKIPARIDFNIHKYVIIYKQDTNEVLAYALISNN